MSFPAKTPRQQKSVVGHKKIQENFLAALETQRLHHAWLFLGDKGIGKATLAYFLTKCLLAPQRDSLLSYDEKSPFLKLIEAGSHPDLFEIERAKDDDGKVARDITIADVRKLQSFFQKKSVYGGYRIAIIHDAHFMNKSASNALLKTLEEPPQKSLLFLLQEPRGNLPVTIYSRCRIERMQGLNDDEMHLLMQQSDATFSKDILAMASGSPGRLLDLQRVDGSRLKKMIDSSLEKLIVSKNALQAESTLRAVTSIDTDGFEIFLSLLFQSLAKLSKGKIDQKNNTQIYSADHFSRAYTSLQFFVEQARIFSLNREQIIKAIINIIQDPEIGEDFFYAA